MNTPCDFYFYVVSLKNQNISSTYSEAVVQKCSVEKVFLENLQDSQESTCTESLF